MNRALDFDITKQPDAIERLFCLEFEKLPPSRSIKVSPALMDLTGKILEAAKKALSAHGLGFTYHVNEVISDRLDKFHSFTIRDHMVYLFLEALTDKHPATLVMYLTYMQYWCKKNNCNTIDINIFFDSIFPKGYPVETDLKNLWYSVKVDRGRRDGSDNLLDYKEAMKSIQL